MKLCLSDIALSSKIKSDQDMTYLAGSLQHCGVHHVPLSVDTGEPVLKQIELLGSSTRKSDTELIGSRRVHTGWFVHPPTRVSPANFVKRSPRSWDWTRSPPYQSRVSRRKNSWTTSSRKSNPSESRPVDLKERLLTYVPILGTWLQKTFSELFLNLVKIALNLLMNEEKTFRKTIILPS